MWAVRTETSSALREGRQDTRKRGWYTFVLNTEDGFVKRRLTRAFSRRAGGKRHCCRRALSQLRVRHPVGDVMGLALQRGVYVEAFGEQ